MLIAMAGLPGTGKSTVARQLAQELSAVVLDKDVVRAALFPPSQIEYSASQDDLCVDVMLQVAGYILRKDPRKHVILDGRTFSRQYQVDIVRSFAYRIDVESVFLECVCSEDTVAERLARDVAQGRHPATNRTYEMYLAVRSRAEPISPPKLVVDTDQKLESVVKRCLQYLYGLGADQDR